MTVRHRARSGAPRELKLSEPTLAGMSRSAFAAAFRDTLGTTPGEYLLRWRVSLAQGLLRGGAAVKRVSDELGHASPAAFTRAFTQLVGESPRAWLKQG